jgi:hypothetical protein
VLPNATPHPEIANWSETRFFGCWNPEDRVGLFVHVGRMRGHLGLWWAKAAAFLPDGTVAVDRSWGRELDNGRGTRTSVLTLGSREASGSVECCFDGGAERATPLCLAQRPGGAGPASRLCWTLEATPVRPRWDLYGGAAHRQDWAGGTHTQQHFQVSGTLEVDDVQYPLDGPGYDDHSTGVRSWDGFGGHEFISVVMPAYGVFCITTRASDGKQLVTAGALCRHDTPDLLIVSASVDELTDLTGAPHNTSIDLVTADGESLELRAEVQHVLPMMVTDENANINGIDWDAPGDPLIIIECVGRYRASDGTIGYGPLERSVRRSLVDRNTLQIKQSL